MSPSEWRGSCFPESLGKKKTGQGTAQRDGDRSPLTWLSLLARPSPLPPTPSPHSRSVRWVTTQAKMKAVRNERERINA